MIGCRVSVQACKRRTKPFKTNCWQFVTKSWKKSVYCVQFHIHNTKMVSWMLRILSNDYFLVQNSFFYVQFFWAFLLNWCSSILLSSYRWSLILIRKTYTCIEITKNYHGIQALYKVIAYCLIDWNMKHMCNFFCKALI